MRNSLNKKNANNIFMTGIPNKMNIDGADVTDPKVIIKHVLTFVNPQIQPEDYKILKSFEPREGHDRHSAKICCTENNIKKKTFEGCRKFKDIPDGSPMKKIFLKNEDTPLQKKENDRLYKQLRELRDAEEDPDNPVNVYKLRSGKLYKNDEVIDTFNLENQLFA